MAKLKATRPYKIVKDLTGQRFNRWTVLRFGHAVPTGDGWIKHWWCRCDCGTERAVLGGSLTGGVSKSCGCFDDEQLRARVKNIVGKRYGRLVVLARAGSVGKRSRWLCRCDCGTTKEINAHELRGGDTVSCGRHKNEQTGNRFRKHGQRGSREYRIWQGMLTRCTNKDCAGWPDYGGRGIKVCPRWFDFANFLADMGAAPTDKHSIDRFPDVNGNYEPGNVRWATRDEQNNNKRNNIVLTYDGQSLTMSQWARKLETTPAAIRNRLQRNWPVERALGQPFRGKNTGY